MRDGAKTDLANSMLSLNTRRTASISLWAPKAWVIAALGGAASAQGCARNTNSCADFRVHSGVAAFSIGTTDELDVAPLVRRLQPGQVVAIGEGTHGTHEYRRLQILVMQSLIEDHGYTAVASEGIGIEASWINEYICGANEPFDPFVASSSEYYDAIDWLQAYNRKRGFKNCVEFIPLDPHDGGRAPIVYIISTLEAKALDLGVSEDHESCLREWIDRNAAVYNPCRPAAAKSLEQSLTNLGPDVADLREAARFAQDAAAVAKAGYADPARDYFMAANIIAALDKHPNGVVVWAHDAHISEGTIDPHLNGGNGDNTMGSFSSRALGDRYVSIAQLSRRGTASMFDVGQRGHHDVHFAAKPNFFERLVGDADMAVDLRDLAPGNPAWECAMSEHRVMWLGSVHTPRLTWWGSPIVPGASFDIVVFLGETTSAKLPKGRRLNQRRYAD